MEKKLKHLIIFIVLVLTFNCFCVTTFARDNTQSESEDITQPIISSGKICSYSKQYSEKNIAVSNLLKMGWTMTEISDLSEDEILKYSNVVSYETSESYICSYTDENNEEQVVSVPKDVFDHVVSKSKAKENENAGIEISNMSSNGKLSISPIWSSEYYDAYVFSGKMSQKANLTWMGNNTYFSNYRCEWVTEPNVKWRDIMYICNNGGLNLQTDTAYFVYKYYVTLSTTGERFEEVHEYGNTSRFITKSMYDNGIGYKFELDGGTTMSSSGSQYRSTDTHRMYMSHNLTVKSGYNSVVTSAGYYHATSKLATTDITGITSTGATLSSNLFMELCNPTLYLNATNY